MQENFKDFFSLSDEGGEIERCERKSRDNLKYGVLWERTGQSWRAGASEFLNKGG